MPGICTKSKKIEYRSDIMRWYEFTKAQGKSKTIYDKYNIPCIADETGLEVHALNGQPGVFSARYAGEKANTHDNIKK